MRPYNSTPRSCLTLPATWPHGRATNVSAAYAQRFVQKLLDALGKRSYRELARMSGIRHTTIAALVRGDSWPDLTTVAAIENALAADLWPGPDVMLEELQRLRQIERRYLRSEARIARQ